MEKKFLLVFISFFAFSNASNIFAFFPTPSFSHQIVFHGLMKELASKGHSMTIITTDIIESLTNNPNVTQIDLHFSYDEVKNELATKVKLEENNNENDAIKHLLPIIMELLNSQLNHVEVKKIISNFEKFKFDVVIIEYLFYYPLVAFGELFKCPVIGISSTDATRQNHIDMGNEANSVVQADGFLPLAHGLPLKFSERFVSSIQFFFLGIK